jgi:hypothetical protein
MIVTDKKYYLDNLLKAKLDLMIDRMKHGKDNLLLIDGNEGDGKSNIAIELGYYFAHSTNRPFSLENIFFDLDKLIDFAIKTKEQVIIWDEGALGGLAAEWWSKNQKKLLKLLMVARKKKHFWIICIPKFFKLNEYLIIDRSIGLVHVYMRNGIEHGRFTYYSERAKERLYEDWKKTHIRNYRNYFSAHGSFVLGLGTKWCETLIKEKEYDKKKDDAIMSIKDSKEEKKQHNDALIIMNTNIKIMRRAQAMGFIKKNKDIMDLLGISETTLRRYKHAIKEGKIEEVGEVDFNSATPP